MLQVNENGIDINVVGVGTSNGGPIPYYNDKGQRLFKKDKKDNFIISKIEDQVLNEIAYKTNGNYYKILNHSNISGTIASKLDKREKRSFNSQKILQFESKYQFFVLLALFFLILESFIPLNRG